MIYVYSDFCFTKFALLDQNIYFFFFQNHMDCFLISNENMNHWFENVDELYIQNHLNFSTNIKNLNLWYEYEEELYIFKITWIISEQVLKIWIIDMNMMMNCTILTVW